MNDLAFPVVFLVIWLGFVGLAVGGLVFWIVKLVEAARPSDLVYRSVGAEKTTWILILALTGFIGALIWQFSDTRTRVLAAPGVVHPMQAWSGPSIPVAPPGWYPAPNQPGVLRYWDGQVWTVHEHRP